MADLDVEPELLNALARAISGAAATVGAADPAATTANSEYRLPGTATGQLLAVCGEAVAQAYTAVAARLEEVARLCGHTAENYRVTESAFTTAMRAFEGGR